jgi:hypothetical protein
LGAPFIRNQLRGRTELLDTSSLRKCVADTKADLQNACVHLSLGWRLHLHAGAGAKIDVREGQESYVASLGMICFPITDSNAADGTIRLNGHWLKINP